MIVNKEQGREHDRQQGKREGNMEKGRGGKGMHRFGKKGTYISHTPQTASGRERGKGKAGRESGKGTLLYETCNKHRTDLKHVERPLLGVCIRDQRFRDQRFRDQTITQVNSSL